MINYRDAFGVLEPTLVGAGVCWGHVFTNDPAQDQEQKPVYGFHPCHGSCGYEPCASRRSPSTSAGSIASWRTGQDLAYVAVRVSRQEAEAACAARGSGTRLASTAEWGAALGDMLGGPLGGLMVDVMVSLYDFGDNGGR